MHIRRLRIENYKSFDDSGWIEFSEGFNIVVGKNSSGKTALLEALRLTRAQPRPHLSLTRPRDEPLAPASKFKIEAVLSNDELRKGLLIQEVNFPVPLTGGSHLAQNEHASRFVDMFLSAKSQTIYLDATAGGSISPSRYPSHGAFKLTSQGVGACVHLRPKPDRQSFEISSVDHSNSDSATSLFSYIAERQLYVFKAERLNIGEITFAAESILTENASNLPRVLNWLITNPAQFERYNRHVNQVFPYIKRVSVVPKSNGLEVRLWWVDTDTEREDLAVPLQESGTGVSQVLGILFVAMTITKGTLVIDEPNTFLHPGAAKTLIEILAQYNHQYIISTHSPEIIAAANPSALFIVRWTGGNSSVQRVERATIVQQREILAELGVSAADVFGADQIIWVEGPTEQECFPLIAQRALGSIPTSIDFLAVRSVDEIARKQRSDDLVLDIYRRLSTAHALLPNPIHFSFDRERQSEEYIARVTAETKGKVRFLPVRCFECYLMHPTAIVAVLNTEVEEQGAEAISEELVWRWLNSNGLNYGIEIQLKPANLSDNWRGLIDAPALLSALFFDLAKVEYSKTRHSRALTEWLLSNAPEHVRELSDYVISLLAL